MTINEQALLKINLDLVPETTVIKKTKATKMFILAIEKNGYLYGLAGGKFDV